MSIWCHICLGLCVIVRLRCCLAFLSAVVSLDVDYLIGDDILEECFFEGFLPVNSAWLNLNSAVLQYL